MKLRRESLLELSGLLLMQEDELPPALVSELKNFRKGHAAAVQSCGIDWDHDPRPYVRVAASIAADIIRGDLKPGDQIPSQAALASKHGVSVNTAAKAVRLLASIGTAELDSNAYWVAHQVPPLNAAPPKK